MAMEMKEKNKFARYDPATRQLVDHHGNVISADVKVSLRNYMPALHV